MVSTLVSVALKCRRLAICRGVLNLHKSTFTRAAMTESVKNFRAYGQLPFILTQKMHFGAFGIGYLRAELQATVTEDFLKEFRQAGFKECRLSGL